MHALGASRGHRHEPTEPGDEQGSVRTWLAVAMAAVAALTVLGLVAFWPRGEAPDLGVQPRTYVDATIVGQRTERCPGVEIPEQLEDCTVYDARLSSGPDDGDTVDLAVRPTQTEVPELSEGDDVVLLHVPSAPATFQYSFEDFQRGTPLLWLVVAFVVVVLLFGRLQGLRALAGLGLSLGVLVYFVVPALLRDSPAVPVALVGTITVAFLAIYLAHGFGTTSSIALAGTLVSLAATCLLAVVVASLTELSGLATQEAQVLRVTAEALDLRGLLLAGIVVGALGVVDDVTVSQVSTVAALRRANPAFGPRQLYAEATRVGRDHVASAVNTLVLAYAGASLPLLLYFAQGDQPVGRLLTGELVAVEVVRMLVGSIGLVLSVPVTTRLAAVILTRTAPLPDDGHGHTHGLVPPPDDPYGPLDTDTNGDPTWSDRDPARAGRSRPGTEPGRRRPTPPGGTTWPDPGPDRPGRTGPDADTSPPRRPPRRPAGPPETPDPWF